MNADARTKTRRALVILTALLSTSALPLRADLIGDGPRAYLPPPVDVNVIAMYGMQVSGNSVVATGLVSPQIDLELETLVTQFTRTFNLADRYAAVTVVQPHHGDLQSTIRLPNAPALNSRTSASGLGDTQLLMTMGLHNLPPLTRQTYAEYKPGLAVGGLLRLTIPTGEYSSSEQVNLGANRYALQIGAPITYAVGDSLLDPNLTTFDLVPSVTFFDDNDKPFGAGTLEQSALLKLEAHVTRNFNPALWASVDALYSYGGETRIDGVDQSNEQSSLGLGLTLGLQLSKSLGVKVTYGNVVYRNDDGMNGDSVRITLTNTRI